MTKTTTKTPEQIERKRAYTREYNRKLGYNERVVAPGQVYIMGTGNLADPVKIGYTSRAIATRLSEAQMESWLPLKVMAISEVIAAPDRLEAELHQEFARKRVRGEWFQLSRRQRASLALRLRSI